MQNLTLSHKFSVNGQEINSFLTEEQKSQAVQFIEDGMELSVRQGNVASNERLVLTFSAGNEKYNLVASFPNRGRGRVNDDHMNFVGYASG